MNKTERRFDFALSFAGSQRITAKKIYQALKDAGYEVFFDEHYEHEMLGQDGSVYLHKIYSRDSYYCIVLMSQDYDQRKWTKLEREAIRSRELRGERGSLLPISIEGYLPDWLPETRIYFDLEKRTIEELIECLVRLPKITIDSQEEKQAKVKIELEKTKKKVCELTDELKRARDIHEKETIKNEYEKEAIIIRKNHDFKDYQEFEAELDNLSERIYENFPKMPTSILLKLQLYSKNILRDMWNEDDVQKRVIQQSKLIELFEACHTDMTNSKNSDKEIPLPKNLIELIELEDRNTSNIETSYKRDLQSSV